MRDALVRSAMPEDGITPARHRRVAQAVGSCAGDIRARHEREAAGEAQRLVLVEIGRTRRDAEHLGAGKKTALQRDAIEPEHHRIEFVVWSAVMQGQRLARLVRLDARLGNVVRRR